MKIISDYKNLEHEFKRLINEYESFYWATAWASSSSTVFNNLIENKQKIKKVTVGTHFYQTDPNFIEEFLNDNRVHFIEQTEGTFHPKVYLFLNDLNNWELIIGSANFTNGAFSKNTEVSVLLNNLDDNSKSVFIEINKVIESSYKNGIVFNEQLFLKYKSVWKNQKQKIKSLSGLYGADEKQKAKPIYESEIAKRDWNTFVNDVLSEKTHSLASRLRVIEIAQNLFKEKKKFSEFTEDERKFVAGIPNKLSISGAENWGYFGSMKGAGVFKNKIKEDYLEISNALDEIPISGQITKAHYDNFISVYSKVFSGNYLGTATRLLAMKRPDIFVCLDSKNRSNLCKDFGVIQSEMNYERYWDDIILRIYDSDWWLNSKPKNEIEKAISNARAAFLDSLYYEK